MESSHLTRVTVFVLMLWGSPQLGQTGAQNLTVEDHVEVRLPPCKLLTLNKTQVTFVANSSTNVQLKVGNLKDILPIINSSSDQVSVCYPVSPQLLQCRKQLRRLKRDDYQMLSDLTLRLSNETIGLRDYYVAPNESELVVFACAHPINKDRSARCSQDVYVQGEYAIEGVDNETVVLINSNVTLYRPQYKLMPDRSMSLCYPLHLDVINCNTLGMITKKDYEINSDHQCQRIRRGCADVPPLDPGLYLMQRPLLNVVYCTSVSKPTFDSYAILTAMYMVSAIFLMIAVVLHLLLPALNYHAKPLLCHMTTLMTMYLVMFCRKYMGPPGAKSCYTIFAFNYISMMGSFLWINVMAFDLWAIFAKMNASSRFSCQRLAGGSQNKRFIFYNIYAWGVPALLIMFIVILDNTESLQEATGLRPEIHKFCWFNERKSSYALLYGPLFVVILINALLFVWTVFNLRGAGKGTQMVNKNVNRQLLFVCIRLFIVMGLCWTMEAITFPLCIGPEVFYIPHSLVALQGVIIFIVYICKRNTWNLIRKKCTRMSTRKSGTNAHVNSDRSTTTSAISLNSVENTEQPDDKPK